MNKLILILIPLFFACNSEIEKDLVTPFEKSDSLETTTYEEGIRWWRNLESSSNFVNIQEFGSTDAGKPLHIIIISSSGKINLSQVAKSDKTIWLINNGIHPGEPDGIDASMLYARDLVESDEFHQNFKDVLLLIIPFYNVGGALNRNCCSRTNQNGPKAYGFRGNARNLDLNRDFIKCDSKNAQSFAQLISKCDPDVYLETHVSNGADYPYTMTYLLSHPDKLTPPLSSFMREKMDVKIQKGMMELDEISAPYVNVWVTSPDSGFSAFYDSPRYSTGYLALHQTLALLTETHMLKPFGQRVEATLKFMRVLGQIVCENSAEIKSIRVQAIENMLAQSEFVLNWKTDYENSNTLMFKGHEAYIETSNVTNLPQLYYNSDSTWEREIKYFDKLIVEKQIKAPAYYLIPSAWYEVVDRLRSNGVEMKMLKKDTILSCEIYRISEFETNKNPYEGHYFHYNTKVESFKEELNIRKDEYYLISTDQKAKRYIIEVLEPEGDDSFFNWNFYDEILQQKEWFSDYVFDQEASEMLKNEEMRLKFEAFLRENPDASSNSFAQLYFLYKQSAHFEKDRFMIYPVYRVGG